MSHKIIFAVLPVAHQIRILTSYQNYAMQHGAKKLTPLSDPDPLVWYDKIEAQYQSLRISDRRSTSVKNTYEDFHQSIKRSYCELCTLCLRLKQPIPGDHDPVARSVIGRILKHTHFEYEYTKTTTSKSAVFLPSSSSSNNSHDTCNSAKLSVGNSAKSRIDPKPKRFESTTQPPSALVKPQVIKRKPKWTHDINVIKVHPGTIEAVSFQEMQDVEVESSTDDSCDHTKAVGLTNTTSSDQSTQTDDKILISSILPRLSSKIRRIFKRVLNGENLPLSSWEVRRYCAIIYRTVGNVPAKVIRRMVHKCLGISKNAEC